VRRADLRSVAPLRAKTSQKLVSGRDLQPEDLPIPDLVALKEQTQSEADEQAGCPNVSSQVGSAPRMFPKPRAMKPWVRKAVHAPNNTAMVDCAGEEQHSVEVLSGSSASRMSRKLESNGNAFISTPTAAAAGNSSWNNRGADRVDH